MKTILIYFLLFIQPLTNAFEIHDEIAGAIKSGSGESVAKYFATNVDLTIVDKEGTYSKQQAGQILKDFFSKHPVKDFRILHKGEAKDGSKYAIGTLNANDGNYRVYFLVKKQGDRMLINQLRFENE